MSDAAFFIATYPASQQDIMMHFHDRLTRDYQLTDKMRYNLPFYYGNSWICYLNPNKTGVELAFIRGNELGAQAQQYLVAKGRKQVLSIHYQTRDSMTDAVITPIIEAAIALDKNVPYAAKRYG